MTKSALNRGSLAAACLAFLACVTLATKPTVAADQNQTISTSMAKQLNFARLSTVAPAIQSDFISDDYLSDVCQQGMYQWQTSKLPIKVYVASGAGVHGYRAAFRSMILDAFNQWKAASGGKLVWKEVYDRNSADITVDWTTEAKQLPQGTEAGETNALTRLNTATNQGIIYGARMHFLTSLNGQEFSDREMRRTCLHEAGHALGLQGHSPDSQDVMYYAISPNQQPILSERDRATIAHLYNDYPASSNLAMK